MRAVSLHIARMPAGSPEVRIFEHRSDAEDLALDELRQVARRDGRPLVSFATGATYTGMLKKLHQEAVAARIPLSRIRVTHLDEYEGLGPKELGSMVHELCEACPSLRAMVDDGSFTPVPCVADARIAERHEQELMKMGGVALQYLGIGRNGHLAFHEPFVPFDRGYHIAQLSETTRKDAAGRFGSTPVPHRAITAGIATILRSARIVLSAFGLGKANAVASMLRGEAGPSCPASALRSHQSVLVLVDREAASLL